MRTKNGLVNGLVNELNGLFGYGDFYIDKDDEMDSYTLYMKFLGNDYGLIELSKEYRSWIALPTFGLASADVQKNIMDFIYSTDNNHWFDEPEKKYNIVLVKYSGVMSQTAYLKASDTDRPNKFKLVSLVKDSDLKQPQYIFTESEVEDLKSKVSEKSAEIIELAKVEVKDD